MSEEELIMLEAKVDMVDIISKHPGKEMETVSMLGEEDKAKFLEVAIDSVKNGFHTINSSEIPKNQLN